MPKKRINRLKNLEEDILVLMKKGERYYTNQLLQLIREKESETYEKLNWKTVNRFLDGLVNQGKVKVQKISTKIILWYR